MRLDVRVLQPIQSASSSHSICDAAPAWPAAAGLVDRHLLEVMSQSDAALREAAASQIYRTNCFIVGPDEALDCGPVGATRYGSVAACQAAARLQRSLPGCDFLLAEDAVTRGPVTARRWAFGPPEDPMRHRGVEFALCDRGGIEACFSVHDDGERLFDHERIFLLLSTRSGALRGSRQSWVRDGIEAVTGGLA